MSIGSNLNLDCVVSYYEAMLARKMRVLAISFLEKTPSLFKCMEFFPTHLEHQQVSGGGRERTVCGLRIWEAKTHLFKLILAQMNPLCVGRSKPRCVTQMNPLCVGRSKSQHECTQPHVCICRKYDHQAQMHPLCVGRSKPGVGFFHVYMCVSVVYLCKESKPIHPPHDKEVRQNSPNEST